MPESRRTITVDGLAASGKSILSKRLAESLGYAHLNSGLLYRGAAWLALQGSIPLEDENALVSLLSACPLSLETSTFSPCVLFVAGRECTGDLAAANVSEAASKVAKLARVRELLLPVQREAFPGQGVVAEGRDMGTVVFPAAPVKFFIEANLEVRAQRRYAQLQESDKRITLKDVIAELAARDERDASRDIAPMKSAQGAVVIDNSYLGLDEIVASMLRHCQ